MNPDVDWDSLVHETYFTDDEPDAPMDSAGHDEVVYVGSVGGSPKEVSAAEVETQQALLAQEAMLQEAQAEAEKRAKLVEALGEEEAKRYLAFRQGEGRKAPQPSGADKKGAQELQPGVMPRRQPDKKELPARAPMQEYFHLGSGGSTSNLSPVR